MSDTTENPREEYKVLMVPGHTYEVSVTVELCYQQKRTADALERIANMLNDVIRIDRDKNLTAIVTASVGISTPK